MFLAPFILADGARNFNIKRQLHLAISPERWKDCHDNSNYMTNSVLSIALLCLMTSAFACLKVPGFETDKPNSGWGKPNAGTRVEHRRWQVVFWFRIASCGFDTKSNFNNPGTDQDSTIHRHGVVWWRSSVIAKWPQKVFSRKTKKVTGGSRSIFDWKPQHLSADKKERLSYKADSGSRQWKESVHVWI